MVPYEGMTCPSCTRPLFIDNQGDLAAIFCESCGVVETGRTQKCRSPRCESRIFWGGKTGKTPISVTTGTNHFADCVDAQRFRR